MSKRILVCAVALLLVAGVVLAKGKGTKGSWTGWITDSACGAKGTSESHAACATKCVKEKGAKWALYNEGDKKVYILDPQDTAAAHAGHHVTVKGHVEGDTIHVKSISMVSEPPKKVSEHPKKG